MIKFIILLYGTYYFVVRFYIINFFKFFIFSILDICLTLIFNKYFN